MRGKRNTQTCCLQCRFIRPFACTAIRQSAVNNDGRNKTNAQLFSAARDFRVFHIHDTNITGRAGETLYHGYGLFAHRASSSENLYCSLGRHSILLGTYFSMDKL